MVWVSEETERPAIVLRFHPYHSPATNGIAPGQQIVQVVKAYMHSNFISEFFTFTCSAMSVHYEEILDEMNFSPVTVLGKVQYCRPCAMHSVIT